MNANGKPDWPIDMWLWDQNRRRIPPEVLEPYHGQWVAISGDGTRIVAAGADLEAVEVQLDAMGIDGSTVGFDRIPAPDEPAQL